MFITTLINMYLGLSSWKLSKIACASAEKHKSLYGWPMGSKGHLSLSLLSNWLFLSRLQLLMDILGRVPNLGGRPISVEVKQTHR